MIEGGTVAGVGDDEREHVGARNADQHGLGRYVTSHHAARVALNPVGQDAEHHASEGPDFVIDTDLCLKRAALAAEYVSHFRVRVDAEALRVPRAIQRQGSTILSAVLAVTAIALHRPPPVVHRYPRPVA